MLNKPAPNQQSHGEQDGHDSQPVLAGPPQRQQEADAQHDAGDLARHNVEPAEGEQRPDQARPQVPGRQRKGLLAAAHVRHPAFVRVQRDGLDAPARAARGYGVPEFVEGDDEHLRM